MKRSSNHLLRTEPTFLDIGLGPNPSTLIDWLNENRGNRRYRRLVGVLTTIRQANTLKRSAFTDDKARGAVSEMFYKINATLRAFSVFPHFGPIAAESWPTWWMPTEAGEMQWLRTKRRESAVARVGECNAVLTLVGLVRAGRLRRVSECDQCGEWFYAKRLLQRFCKTPCQQKAHRSTRKFKEHRKEYMRRYRRDVLGLGFSARQGPQRKGKR